METAHLAVALVLYLGVVRALRRRRAAYVRALRKKDDPHALAWQLAFVEFPFMFDAGTSLGFFSTFAVPTIAAVLRRTREFSRGCQARYDDTALLMHEIGEKGPRSRRGRAALRRVNEIHARTTGIARDDMLYTLWVFAFEPARWIDAYEWRRLEPFEYIGSARTFVRDAPAAPAPPAAPRRRVGRRGLRRTPGLSPTRRTPRTSSDAAAALSPDARRRDRVGDDALVRGAGTSRSTSSGRRSARAWAFPTSPRRATNS